MRTAIGCAAASSNLTAFLAGSLTDSSLDVTPTPSKLPPDRDGKKRLVPDVDLRDTEDVPLTEDVGAYFEREVKPYTPDAWVSDEVRDPKDEHVGRVGYEIAFNRYFYVYEAPPSLAEIDEQLKARAGRIMALLGAVVG